MDQVMRLRLELDKSGLMSDMSAIEAHAGGQIAQMLRPIEHSLAQTYQSGMQAITSTQAMFIRANQYQSAPFHTSTLSQTMTEPPGFSSSVAGALRMDPSFYRDYRYTPVEQAHLHAQRAGRIAEEQLLGNSRAVLQAAAGFSGGAAGLAAGGAAGGWLGAAAGGILGGMVGLPTAGAWLGGTIGGLYGGGEGASAGNKLGTALYGPFGGAQLGGFTAAVLGGSSAAVAAGGLAGAVVGTGVQLITEQVAARNQLRPLVEQIGAQAAIFGSSTNPMGTGYNVGQINSITNKVLGTASRDYRFDLQDYGAIIQAGANAGRFDTASTVDKFMDTTKDLVESVKVIQTGLRKTLDESLPVLQQAIAMGATNKGQVRDIVARTRSAAMVTGLSPDELLQAGEVGTALTRGWAYNTTGQKLGIEGAAGARFIRAIGAIRSPTGEDETWKTIQAAGGETVVGQGVARFVSGFMQSGTADAILMSMYDPKTRKLNQRDLEDYSRGTRTTLDMINQGASNMADFDSLTKYRADKARVLDDLTPGQQAQVFLQGLRQEAAASPWGGTAEGVQAIFRSKAERLGMSPMEAKAVFAAVQKLPTLEVQMQRAEEASAAAFETDDRLREVGIAGYIRRGRIAVRGAFTDLTTKAAETLYDPAVEAIGEFYNRRILGQNRNIPVRVGEQDILPALEAVGPKSPFEADLRETGRPSGVLPFLFGPPQMTMSGNEQFAKRLGTAAAYVPGYGSVVDVPTSTLKPGQGLIPLHDNWDGSTSAFVGTGATLQSAEQENSRLREVLGDPNKARNQSALMEGMSEARGEAYKQVEAAIGRFGGSSAFGEMVRGEAGGSDPNLTKLVSALGLALQGPSGQPLDTSNAEVRNELARRSAEFLTPAQIEQLGKSINAPYGSPETVKENLEKAANTLKDAVGSEVFGTENQDEAVRMAGAMSKMISSGEYGKLDADQRKEKLLEASGATFRDSKGNLVFKSGFSERIGSLKDIAGKLVGKANAAVYNPLKSREEYLKEYAADLGNVGTAVQQAQGEQITKAVVSVTGHYLRGSKELNMFQEEIEKFSASTNPDERSKMYDVLFGLDDKDSLEAFYKSKGATDSEAKAKAAEATKALQAMPGLETFVSSESKVEGIVTDAMKGLKPGEQLSVDKQLEITKALMIPTVGKGGNIVGSGVLSTGMSKHLAEIISQRVADTTGADREDKVGASIRQLIGGAYGVDRGPTGERGGTGAEDATADGLKQFLENQNKVLSGLVNRVFK